MVWGGPGPVSGMLVIALHPGTGSYVCTRVFATSFNVSDNVQKNLGESTHPIGSTRSIQMMMQSSLAADGMR